MHEPVDLTHLVGPDELIVSVVIPARNAAGLIGLQLRSLAAQDTDVPYEVIVADNGSSDGTWLAATRAAASAGLPIRVVDAGTVRGTSHARNIGAAHASGTVLLFLDADDELEPGYLTAMADALRSHPLVSARLHTEERAGDDPTQSTPYGVVFGAGGTLGMWRSSFLELDGFDESIHYGEDVELCLRARRAGLVVMRVPDAVLMYRPRPSARAAFRQGLQRGKCEPELYRRFGAEWAQPRSFYVVGRTWAGLTRRALRRQSDSADRRVVAYHLGKNVGRLVGSVRSRTAYL